MSKTPWTNNHERIGKIRSSGAVMSVVPAVYVRELEKELIEARAEIERLKEQLQIKTTENLQHIGTINVLTEKAIIFNKPPIQTDFIQWTKDFPPEQFKFVPCDIECNGRRIKAMVYIPSWSPHTPSTRKWEIIASKNLGVVESGDSVTLIFRNISEAEHGAHLFKEASMGNSSVEELYQEWVKQNGSEEGSGLYSIKQLQAFAAYCIKSTNEDVGTYKQALKFIASDLFGTGAKSGAKAHEIARKVLSSGAENNAR